MRERGELVGYAILISVYVVFASLPSDARNAANFSDRETIIFRELFRDIEIELPFFVD